MSTVTSGFKSKQEQVREHLLRELRSGSYRPGSRFASETDLVSGLGISRNTLREALTSLVSEGYLKRIQGNGTFVTGKLLRQQRKDVRVKLLAFVAFNPHGKGERDPFISDLLRGVHSTLDDLNWGVKLICISSLPEAEAVTRRLAEEDVASAVILAGFDVAASTVAPLQDNGIATVSVGIPLDPSITYVDTDNRGALRQATDYLLQHGHRRIALVDRSSSHHHSFLQRQRGYEEALRHAGVTLESELLVDYNGFDVEAGVRAAEMLLQRNVAFTAAIVYGDWPTLGFIRGMRQHDIAIPDQVSVISSSPFDQLLQASDIRVTHMANPFSELGALAARVATGIAAPEENAVPLPYCLQVGETVVDLT